MPKWSDFEFLDLSAKVIPHLVVVDILNDPFDFYYRFWGTWHANFHAYDFTGKTASELRPVEYRDIILDQYKEAAITKEPILFMQQIPLKAGLWVHTELLRLPFSDDGENNSKIISIEMARDSFENIQEFFAEEHEGDD